MITTQPQHALAWLTELSRVSSKGRSKVLNKRAQSVTPYLDLFDSAGEWRPFSELQKVPLAQQNSLQILNTHPYIHFEIVKRIKIRAWILVSHKEEEN